MCNLWYLSIEYLPCFQSMLLLRNDTDYFRQQKAMRNVCEGARGRAWHDFMIFHIFFCFLHFDFFLLKAVRYIKTFFLI